MSNLPSATTETTRKRFRGKRFSSKAVKLPKGRYFIVDVVGCDAVLGGKVIGKVTDVNQNAPIDVYVLDDGKIMFPSAENVLEKVDVENKTITLNEEAFSRLAVYDNL